MRLTYYDDLDRLTQADYIDSTDEVFTYDDLGNRLTLNTRGDQDVAYLHNVANEYTSIGGQSVSHDAAGNLSADDNGYTYEYDHDNRLTKIEKRDDTGNVTVAEFTYDALGRRIEFIDSITTTTTRYYYDGWRVLSETNAAGDIQRSYTYGNYLDETLILTDSTGAPDVDHYYAHNHLFSPVALLADDGSIEEYYEYDVYGKATVITDDGGDGDWWDGDETIATVSDEGNPVMFTGQQMDTLDDGDLQLMYYKNRYYCPNTGRFLQRDKLKYIDGMNLYEYCQSNSIIHIDPYGGSTTIYGVEFPTNLEDILKILKNLIRKIENSKDPSERCYLIRQLYATIAYAGAGLKMQGDDSFLTAAQYMIHWLRGSGERRFVSKDFILSYPPARQQYELWKKETIEYVNTHKCDDAEAASDRTPTFDPPPELYPSVFFAVGEFRMRVAVRPDSRKKCPPCSIHIDFKLTFIDKYDWTKGDDVNLFGVRIPDDYALELESCDHPHGAVKPKPFKLNTGFWESLGCVKCLK